MLGLLWGEAVSAQEKLHRITQFGTLNTLAGDFSMEPGDSRIAHNIDWGRNVGSITKRFGYDSVSFISGQDSVVGLFGAYYSDGTQQLIVVTDSAGVGYGNVYASPIGKAHFTGTQEFDVGINVHNNYQYQLFLVTGGLTDTASYTSDGSATQGEILANLETAVDTISAMQPFIFSIVNPFSDLLQIREKVEFAGTAVTADSATTVTTRGDSVGTIWTHFAIFNKPSFAMYRDVVFGVNGSHRGIAYNGDVARAWPLNAPGEPTIVPLTTTGPLDGEYRYAFTYLRGLEAADSSYGTVGAVTMPVRVTNGQILLRDFQWVGADTIDAAPDSVGVVVYRTRANPRRLDQRDSAFLIDTVWGTSAADLATKTLQDSVADVDFANGVPIWINDFIGRDSVRLYNHRYGAPTYLSTDSIFPYTSLTDTTYNAGIFHGIPDQIDTLGVQYIVTFVDTVLGIESNASPPLAIMQADSATKAWSYRIGLPAPVDGDSGIVRNVYRSHILQVTHDTTETHVWVDTSTSTTGDDYNEVIFTKYKTDWKYLLAVDTVLPSEYYLVAQVTLDSTAFTDSVRWDSLITSGRLFAQSTPPPFMTQIFSHDGRMFGIAGSRLYVSRLDSASAWGARDFVALDESDGDQNTLAFVSRGVIRVLKNHSSFNVYQDANLKWNRREVSGFWGCIAPYSHAAGPLGHYYLSDRGVLREAEGQFLERTQSIELISSPLDNFTALPITTLDDAVGFYFDQKYMLSIGDTTYVYDERAKAWSTWGFKFAAATLYGTEDELNFLPGDSMYFIRPGESNLNRYGTSENDNAVRIVTSWRSGPLFIQSPRFKQINAIELAYNDGVAADSVSINLYNDQGAQIQDVRPGGLDALVFDGLTGRYQKQTVEPHVQPRYYELLLVGLLSTTSSGTTIDMIDTWYIEGPLGEGE